MTKEARPWATGLGRLKGAMERALAPRGAILVYDAALGGLVESGRNLDVFRFRHVELARGDRRAKLSLPGLQAAENARVACATPDILPGALSCGFNIGHEKRLVELNLGARLGARGGI